MSEVQVPENGCQRTSQLMCHRGHEVVLDSGCIPNGGLALLQEPHLCGPQLAGHSHTCRCDASEHDDGEGLSPALLRDAVRHQARDDEQHDARRASDDDALPAQRQSEPQRREHDERAHHLGSWYQVEKADGRHVKQRDRCHDPAVKRGEVRGEGQRCRDREQANAGEERRSGEPLVGHARQGQADTEPKAEEGDAQEPNRTSERRRPKSRRWIGWTHGRSHLGPDLSGADHRWRMR